VEIEIKYLVRAPFNILKIIIKNKMKRYTFNVPPIKPTLPSTGKVKEKELIIETLVQCKNCKKMFNPKKNGECRYHPLPGKAILRVHNGYDEIEYECCGAIDKGFNPTYTKNSGCIFLENHIAQEST